MTASPAGGTARVIDLVKALILGSWGAAIAVAPEPVYKLAMAAPAILIPLTLWTLESPGRWIACFFAAALLLPPLAIDLGDSGPHVSLLFAGLGILAGLIWLRQWSLPATALNLAMGALFITFLASLAPAAIYSGGAVAAVSFARVALFGIAVYTFFYTGYGPGRCGGALSPPASDFRPLYWIAVASALFACVDFYFQLPAPAGYAQQFVWLTSGVYRRAQGVFYEAGTLGNLCAFFLTMIATALVKPWGRSAISGNALAMGVPVFVAALVLSYSRSSLVNLFTALVVLLWLNRKRLRLVKIAAVVLISGTGAGLFIRKVFSEFFDAWWLRVSATARFFLSSTEGQLSGRVASWYALRDWIATHPWQALVGIGYKTLPHTHHLGAPLIGDNMYLTLFVETGIIGLAALLWLNVAILRAARRAASAADPRKAFAGTWIFCFWCGQMVQMLSVDLLTFWRVLPMYFWVLALAVRNETPAAGSI